MEKLRSVNLKYHFLALVAVWTTGVLGSLGWNLYQLQLSTLAMAYTTAGISYNKDILYRRWVANQGGVYVPVSGKTPANPYLTVPNRDLKAAGGLSLTLVNPAYMTRQVNELAAEMHEFQGHITSLKPLRPENRPDQWEVESLKAFEQGVKESHAIEHLAGEEYFRFMRPFLTEKSCLKCHAAQGYREGDVRGGISVSIPMKQLRVIEKERRGELMLAHAFLWLIGLAGIAAGTSSLRNQTLKREKLEEELNNLSITDPLTGLYNRRGFLTLAEQQMKLSLRTRGRLILFFADLDGMKRINDSLGHEEGDKALIEASAVLRETFRSSDIVARMGGDEFVALAIDPEVIDPEIIISRLQERIDSQNRRPERKFTLSMSVGYACYDPEDPVPLDTLMTRADNAMYAQKKAKA